MLHLLSMYAYFAVFQRLEVLKLSATLQICWRSWVYTGGSKNITRIGWERYGLAWSESLVIKESKEFSLITKFFSELEIIQSEWEKTNKENTFLQHLDVKNRYPHDVKTR